jgi:hypothetical protein
MECALKDQKNIKVRHPVTQLVIVMQVNCFEVPGYPNSHQYTFFIQDHSELYESREQNQNNEKLEYLLLFTQRNYLRRQM